MNIGFDVSDLATNRADGTTRYTNALAERLPQLAPRDQWHFFTPGPIAKPQATNVHVHESPWPKYWTQARLPFDILKYQPDVLFMPIQQLPILRPAKTKTVAVVHDLAWHYYPEQTKYKDWLLLHAFTAQAVHQADAIIAVSHATANDIAQVYGRTKQVQVVHHGVNHEFFRPVQEELEQQASWENLARDFRNLKRPYLLFVGQIQPRKNVIRLIEAFEQLHTEQPELQLVIAGSHGWLQQPIEQRAAQSPYAAHIHMLGRVSDEQLRSLYWHAELFVLPSLYEGFGMPVLEAMASGCPVVTSQTSSLPEVAGEAAILINPADTQSLLSGIKTAQTEKAELRQRGLQHAAAFTWDICSQKTLEIIKNI
jgi:glycosyltransferase involved in cell wall biosynthesis